MALAMKERLGSKVIGGLGDLLLLPGMDGQRRKRLASGSLADVLGGAWRRVGALTAVRPGRLIGATTPSLLAVRLLYLVGIGPGLRRPRRHGCLVRRLPAMGVLRRIWPRAT